MGKRGPKASPDTEEKVIKSFSFTRSQWAKIEACVPPGERSRVVQECLLREAEQRKEEADA